MLAKVLEAVEIFMFVAVLMDVLEYGVRVT